MTVAATRLPLGAAVAVAGVLGLVIGSFLNVVVYRTPRRLSVNHPRSFCPSCGTPVRPRDNIPVVSWLVLRGRCRACRAPISPRYPLVEAGTGALFAVVAALTGAHWAVPGLCVLAATVAAGAVIEIDGHSPPARAMVTGAALGAAALVAAGVADRSWAHLAGLAVGTAAGGALVLVAGAGAPVAARSRFVLPAAAMAVGWPGGLSSAVGASVAVAGVALVSVAGRRWRVGPSTVLLAAVLAALITASATGAAGGR